MIIQTSQDPDQELPGAPRTLVRTMQLAYRAEPRLIVLSLGMALLEAVPDSLFAVWLMLVGAGVAQGHAVHLDEGAAHAGSARASAGGRKSGV